MTAFGCVLCLGIGNFLYQCFQVTPDFSTAVDRTFFQAGAILVYLLFEKVMA